MEKMGGGKIMVTQEQINRINELARKSKTPEGLTEEEKTIILEGCLMNYYKSQNSDCR